MGQPYPTGHGRRVYHVGSVWKNIQAIQRRYCGQRELLVSVLKSYGVTISKQHDGLNVWVPLAQNSAAIVMQMAQRGWVIRGGEAFTLGSSCTGLRITVSDMEASETELLTLLVLGQHIQQQ